jgi:antitoxin component of RelBE/YafQ-DinJ toxin-antitoxin module
MAQLVIQLDDAILLQLKRRAWEQGLPFEASLRLLLAAAAEEPAPAFRVSKPRDGDGRANSALCLICA